MKIEIKHTQARHLTIIICLVSLFASAQQAEIDSLQNLLPTLAEDTSKILILNRLAWLCRWEYPVESIDYGKEALHLSEKHNYLKGQLKSLSFIGLALRNIHFFPEAVAYYKQALLLAEQNNELEEMCYSYMNLAEINDTTLISKKTSNLYRFRALAIADSLDNDELKNYAYWNIAHYYLSVGNEERYLEYIDKLLQIRLKYQDYHRIGLAYEYFANFYLERKKYDQAMEYYKIVLEYYKQKDAYFQSENGGQLSRVYSYLSQIYLAHNKIDTALLYGKKAIEYGEMASQKRYRLNAYENMNMLYDSVKDYRQQVQLQKKIIALKDSLFNDENLRTIVRKDVGMKLNKKEAEKQMLERQKRFQQYILASTLFIMTLVILFAVYFCSIQVTNATFILVNI